MQCGKRGTPFFIWEPFRILILGRDAEEKEDGN